MALTIVEYTLFQMLRQHGHIRPGGRCLEIGESNWFGDVDPSKLLLDLELLGPINGRKEIEKAIRNADRLDQTAYLFALGKAFYQVMLHADDIVSVDMNGTDSAVRQDLNKPLDLDGTYDFVINIGTAEHVFDIAQVFRSIHHYAAPGALMIHGLPFQGWVDHGFYNFQGTFYFDLATANKYEVIGGFYAEQSPLKVNALKSREQLAEMSKNGEIGADAMLYFFLQKPDQEREFHVPIQGYYAGTLSDTGRDNWNARNN